MGQLPNILSRTLAKINKDDGEGGESDVTAGLAEIDSCGVDAVVVPAELAG